MVLEVYDHICRIFVTYRQKKRRSIQETLPLKAVGSYLATYLPFLLKTGFSNLRDSGICAMNNFEFWRQISLLLFVVCF